MCLCKLDNPYAESTSRLESLCRSPPLSPQEFSRTPKTDEVQDDLQDAALALNAANSVSASPLTAEQAKSALADAVEQNVEAEARVQDAALELETVKQLLQEARTAQAADGLAGNSGEGTASILGYFEGRRAQVREDEAKIDPKLPD
ncbi:MAG: hypothetical protein ABIR26_07190 [Ramlibacter sp.]